MRLSRFMLFLTLIGSILLVSCASAGPGTDEESVASRSDPVTWTSWAYTSMGTSSADAATVFSIERTGWGSAYRKIWLLRTNMDGGGPYWARIDTDTYQCDVCNFSSSMSDYTANLRLDSSLTAIALTDGSFAVGGVSNAGYFRYTKLIWNGSDYEWSTSPWTDVTSIGTIAHIGAAATPSGRIILVFTRGGNPESLEYAYSDNNLASLSTPYQVATLPYPTREHQKPTVVNKWNSALGAWTTYAYIRDTVNYYETRYFGGSCTGTSCWTTPTTIPRPSTFGDGSQELTAVTSWGNNTCQFVHWHPKDFLGNYTATKSTWYRCSTWNGYTGSTEVYGSWSTLSTWGSPGPSGPVPGAVWIAGGTNGQKIFLFEDVKEAAPSIFYHINRRIASN